jgi:lipoate-protein ligase A
MAIDEAIFREVSLHQSPPTIRFYTWDQPSVSIGYFQNALSDLNIPLLAEKKIPWVRRITGGRGVFHHLELTYSFSAPVTLPSTQIPHDIKGSYQKISLGLATGFKTLGFPVQLYTPPPHPVSLSEKKKGARNPICFSTPSRHELLIEGKKVVGSAQKRDKKGFLQQGSILLSHRLEDFSPFFRFYSEVGPQFIGLFDYIKKGISLSDLESNLIAGLEKGLGVTFVKGGLTRRESELAGEFHEKKYGSQNWNLNRLIS